MESYSDIGERGDCPRLPTSMRSAPGLITPGRKILGHAGGMASGHPEIERGHCLAAPSQPALRHAEGHPLGQLQGRTPWPALTRRGFHVDGPCRLDGHRPIWESIEDPEGNPSQYPTHARGELLSEGKEGQRPSGRRWLPSAPDSTCSTRDRCWSHARRSPWMGDADRPAGPWVPSQGARPGRREADSP